MGHFSQSLLHTGTMRSRLHSFLILLLGILILECVLAEEQDDDQTQEGEVKSPRAPRPKGCKNNWTKKPKWYKKGKTLIKGCIKWTCTEPKRRQYVWVTELARTKCCSFNETYYRIGTTLLSRVLPDECTNVALRCRKKEVFADMVIEVEDYCPERPGIVNVLMEPTSTIKSARFPSPFPPKQDECWVRTPSCGHHVTLEFLEFNVLGKGANVTIDPPIDGRTTFFGNSFNAANAPPKTVDFPFDYTVRICFHSGPVVDGHKGFQAVVSQKKNNNYLASPNYPEITDENYLDPPPHGYGPAIHHCTVRAPAKGRALEIEWYQFDLNAPLQPRGDWVTINPNPTQRPKYFGVSLNQNTAPPKHSTFDTDELVSICFKTRDRVDEHDGYVAETWEQMLPSTIDYTDYTYDTYPTYYSDYTSGYTWSY